MAMRRPPLNRGHSMPTYPTQGQSYAPVDSTTSSLASLSLSDARNSPAGVSVASRRSIRARPHLPLGELMGRGAQQPSGEGGRPPTPGRDPDANLYLPYSAYTASPNGSHSQPHSPSYTPPMPRSRSHQSQSSASSSYPFSTHPPAITSAPTNVSSALLRNRSVPPHSSVNLKIDSLPQEYILRAPLGNDFSSDSITVTTRRGNVIFVVADRWDQEQDCHYEWQVQFDRDADMSSTQASFENGVLKITVRRIMNYIVRS